MRFVLLAMMLVVASCSEVSREQHKSPPPRLCQSIKPGLNQMFRGMPIPFNKYIRRDARHFWAWRMRGYSCAIEMRDV